MAANPENCWLSNNNPLLIDEYGEEAKDEQILDLLSLYWGAFLQRLSIYVKDRNLKEIMCAVGESLISIVAFYQGSLLIHKRNPVAGFANFRDSLRHIISCGIKEITALEEDSMISNQLAIDHLLNISNMYNTSKDYSIYPEEITEICKNQANSLLRYDSTQIWPNNSIYISTEEKIKTPHSIACEDIDEIPEIHGFGKLFRYPLLVGLISLTKRRFFDNLSQLIGSKEANNAKNLLIRDFHNDLSEDIRVSNDKYDWPDWAIDCLPASI